MHVSFFCLSIMFCLSYLCVPARSVPFQRYIYGRGHLELLLHAAKLGKSCNSSSYLLKVYAIACINFKMMSIRINSLPRLQVRGRNRSDSFFLFWFPRLSSPCGVVVCGAFQLGSAFDDAQRRRGKQMLVRLPEKPSPVRSQLGL